MPPRLINMFIYLHLLIWVHFVGSPSAEEMVLSAQFLSIWGKIPVFQNQGKCTEFPKAHC